MNSTKPFNLKTFFSKYIILAAIVTAAAPVFYILALKYFELSVAFAFTGFNYIFVSLGGQYFLKEKLNKYHYLGLVSVFLGVCIFSL